VHAIESIQHAQFRRHQAAGERIQGKLLQSLLVPTLYNDFLVATLLQLLLNVIGPCGAERILRPAMHKACNCKGSYSPCFNDTARVMDQNDFNLLFSTINGDADVVPSDEELWNQRQGEIVDSELGEMEGGWNI
jgi:hypothetical protein